MVLAVFIVLAVLSIVICHYIAKKRGANPVFWGVMGAIFGPLAIPFALMSNKKNEK